MSVAVLVSRAMEPDEALGLWRDTSPAAALPTPELRAGRPTRIVLDGETIAVIDRLPESTLATLRWAVRRWDESVTSGGVMRSKGLRNRAGVFGFLAANPIMQRPACGQCGGSRAEPAAHMVLCSTAEVLAARLAELAPEQYAVSERAIEPVHPSWRLPGGLWTSGVVNSSSALPYHRDRNNFDAWSAMPVVRRGVRGGHLSLPELAVGGQPLVLPCGDGDVVYFNGQAWMHGVTPITRRDDDGYRFSVVYYPVRKMANCLPPAEEVARANHRRTTVERDLIERQRKAGLIGGGS